MIRTPSEGQRARVDRDGHAPVFGRVRSRFPLQGKVMYTVETETALLTVEAEHVSWMPEEAPTEVGATFLGWTPGFAEPREFVVAHAGRPHVGVIYVDSRGSYYTSQSLRSGLLRVVQA